MNKKIVYIGIGIIALAGLIGVLLQRTAGPPAPAGALSAFFHFYSSPESEATQNFLDEFRSFYPQIDLETEIKPYQDLRKDFINALEQMQPASERVLVAALSGSDLDLTTGNPAVTASRFSPWVSEAWGLFYNRGRLAEAGYTRTELHSLAAEGLDVFVEEMRTAAGPDEFLFYTGAQYTWPWLAWIQHLQLEFADGQPPAGFTPEEYAHGLERWEWLITAGLMNPDYASSGLAESHFAISRGKALFVLSDSFIYNTYLPGERSEIEFIPFPGAEPQNWQVGSSFYLGQIIPQGAPPRVQAAGALLIEYLRSEGIRDRFLRTTGIRLLPEDTSGGAVAIPSITQKVRDPALKALLDELK